MAKPRTKKVKAESAEAASSAKAYKIVFDFNDKVQEVVTDSIQNAVIELNPGYIKTQVIIKVTNGEKTVERQLFTARAKQLFTNPLTALAFEKNIKLALGE